MIRIAIVEDEPTVRQALVHAIRAEEEMSIVASCGTLAEGLTALETTEPDLVLIDLGLPDGDGIELVERARDASMISLVITIFGDERTSIRAIEAGASGYLLKGARNVDVGDAIRDVMAGGAPISPSIARYLLKRFEAPSKSKAGHEPGPALSEREIEVLRWLSRGFTFKEIAESLSISKHTVGNHVRNIYKKLDVSSKSSAVFEAVQRGIIDI